MKTRHNLFLGTAAAGMIAVAIAAACWTGQARELYGRLFMHRGEVEQPLDVMLDCKDGSPVRTTIDMEYQAIAESCLREAIGDNEDIEEACLAVMEVSSGAIRATANFSRRDSITESCSCLVGRDYEPGEVAQTMTLAAALSDGYVGSLDEMLPTEGGNIKCDGAMHIVDHYVRASGRDSISVLEGFTMSSRYVFAKLSGLYASCPQKFTEHIRAYCLPDSMKFDISGYRRVVLAGPEDRHWDDTILMAMGYGYQYTVTPMHLLSFYNTVAGRGRMMKPYLIESAGNDGSSGPHVIAEEALRPEVADTLKRALLAVVGSGTAKHLKDAKYMVAGKTGTAFQLFSDVENNSVYNDNDRNRISGSSFAGFFPAEAPRYSIICVIFTKPCQRTYFGSGIPAMAVRKFVDSI